MSALNINETTALRNAHTAMEVLAKRLEKPLTDTERNMARSILRDRAADVKMVFTMKGHYNK